MTNLQVFSTSKQLKGVFSHTKEEIFSEFNELTNLVFKQKILHSTIFAKYLQSINAEYIIS